jgi:hypothetical protein
MRKLAAIVAVILLIGAGCSRKEERGAPAVSSAPADHSAPPAPPAKDAPPPPPATLTDVNLAAADMGGAVEELTGVYGPGFIGRRLIDGLAEPTWRAPANWWPGGMYNQIYWTTYPQEVVLSFFERRPALIGALTFVMPEKPTVTVEDPSTAPADLEILTSMDAAPDRYSRAATATLSATGGEQTITFPATEARYVKLRLLSGATKRVVEIAEIRVLESVRDGYPPLFVREPGAKLWKGSPREAAQRGLDWLQQAANDWSSDKKCFGCHIQSQVLMGQAVALEKGYRVSMPAMQALTDFMRTQQTPEGTLSRQHDQASAVFGGMGFAQAAMASGKTSDPGLLQVVDYALKNQAKDGSLPEASPEPPILQGKFMTTGNALVALKWAMAHSQDPKYSQAAERALAWITANDPVTTQDLVFKIVAVSHYGTPDQKRTVWPLVEEVASQQQPDGGWKEVPATKGSNAFATGQVLYAFKQAGVSIRSPMFQRGADYLLKTQVSELKLTDGSWRAVNTQSQRTSDIAPTMWAVIGLAGAYGTDSRGALHVAREQGEKPAPRNLEIVLDVSGSMKTKLGDSTRWQTALKVLEEVVGTLPADLNVGLRAYGHRYASTSAQTCQDTELVVPIGPLDRNKLLQTASKLQPRGETPLIRSVLKTVGDLKDAGGGSVILITDGEESCHGNATSAAAEIKKSGVNVTLNIVGFTLTGKNVETVLAGLAGSTGGHYYGAQDGAQLSRALKIAALQHLPYDVLDGSGLVIASGQTGHLDRDLPPGQYTIKIRALDQVLEAPVTISADQTTSVTIRVEGDRFVIKR